MVQNLVFLHRHQQHVHLVLGGFQQLMAQVHVRDVERNVLAGLRLYPVVQFVFGHQRHADSLDDHRVPGHRSRHVLGFDLLAVEDRNNLLRHRGRIHDRAVDYGVLRQRLDAVTHQLVARFRFLQLDGFHRTRADVQADQRFCFTEIEHRAAPHSSPAPLRWTDTA